MRLNLLVAAIAVVAAATAHAGTTEIAYTTINHDSGDIFVTATDTPSGGAFTVTAITGERDGVSITGLSPYAGSDQLLFATDLRFDFAGVSFATIVGGKEVDFNLFTNNGIYYEISSEVDPIGNASSGVEFASLTVNPVPEPTSIALLGVGVFGLGGLLSRRRIIDNTCA